MKKFIVTKSCPTIVTWTFAVSANTVEEAIEKVQKGRKCCKLLRMDCGEEEISANYPDYSADEYHPLKLFYKQKRS